MFRKILVPLDGSALAASILSHVEDLARSEKSEIVLLMVGHVAGTFAMAEGFSWNAQLIESTIAELRENAERYLAETANKLEGKGLKVSSVYTEGVPAREIIRYAEEARCDLIAMATHGRGEIAWVLGSVAEQVVSHATVPVLVMRVLKAQPLLEKQEVLAGP